MQIPNEDQLKMLLQGREGPWNDWRQANREIYPDLQGAQLMEADLSEMDLSWANLAEADLTRADLYGADLHSANLTKADLTGANLRQAELLDAALNWARLEKTDLAEADLGGAELFNANLRGADLTGADLTQAKLGLADLTGASLSGAYLSEADLINAILHGADLSGADLSEVRLINANLSEANLKNAVLVNASLVGADIENATFTGCYVFGMSAWGLYGEPKDQSNLVITQSDEPTITVDNLEVAQFIYLLLHHEKIRNVIDTIGEKGVLILGRFTEERKAVLDAIRERLRALGFVPMMFDFERPTQRDFTETIKTLAGLSRFIIADITNPKSSPLELQATMPDYMIPFVPIIHESEEPFAMFQDLKQKYGEWVLDVLKYDSTDNLLQVLDKAVVRPALEMSQKLLLKKAEAIRARHVRDYM